VKQVSTARVVALGTADAPGSFVTRPLGEVQLVLGGIAGDRHFGVTMKAGVRQTHHPRGAVIANARQLSIVSVEELGTISSALGGAAIAWQKLGANLVLEGHAKLSQLPASSRLVFPSGAAIAIDSENAPCSKPARELEQPHFVKAAMHLRGLVGWVEREGRVATGDIVTIWQEPT
jgi:MOSC domain-containing protein YiiM